MSLPRTWTVCSLWRRYSQTRKMKRAKNPCQMLLNQSLRTRKAQYRAWRVAESSRRPPVFVSRESRRFLRRGQTCQWRSAGPSGPERIQPTLDYEFSHFFCDTFYLTIIKYAIFFTFLFFYNNFLHITLNTSKFDANNIIFQLREAAKK